MGNINTMKVSGVHQLFGVTNIFQKCWFYADPGYVISGFYPLQTQKAEHGYDNQVMDMKPFFRAEGPDFHSNLLVGPFETVNVYPLMCHLLGIKPEINDGSLDNTRHMLISNGETFWRCS